ncbi:MAG: hypothetical protein QM713_08655 [Arachnia sp.]
MTTDQTDVPASRLDAAVAPLPVLPAHRIDVSGHDVDGHVSALNGVLTRTEAESLA